MEKSIFEKIDELKEKSKLTLDDINNICNEFDDDRRCIDVYGAILQYSSLVPAEKTDLTDFELPNTKETWIEVASALASEYFLSQPMDHVIEGVAKGLEVSEEDIISFLKLRGYIMLIDNQLHATALGIEKGYVLNTNKGLRFTDKCVEKIRKAFTCVVSPEEKEKFEKTFSELKSEVLHD